MLSHIKGSTAVAFPPPLAASELQVAPKWRILNCRTAGLFFCGLTPCRPMKCCLTPMFMRSGCSAVSLRAGPYLQRLVMQRSAGALSIKRHSSNLPLCVLGNEKSQFDHCRSIEQHNAGARSADGGPDCLCLLGIHLTRWSAIRPLNLVSPMIRIGWPAARISSALRCLLLLVCPARTFKS